MTCHKNTIAPHPIAESQTCKQTTFSQPLFLHFWKVRKGRQVKRARIEPAPSSESETLKRVLAACV